MFTLNFPSAVVLLATFIFVILGYEGVELYGSKPPYIPTSVSSVPKNFFPAVEKGAEFRFAIAPTARATEEDMAFAEKALVSAITLHGVGAKTAAGYGWFEYDATDYAALEPDAAKLEEWEAALPSATKQKKEFVKLPEIVDGEGNLLLMRTAVAFIVSKSWWPSEKKNAGSKTTQFVRKWDEKLKLGEF